MSFLNSIDPKVLFYVGILVLFAVLFLLRIFIRLYAKGKIGLIMLKAEKNLLAWAKERAATGREKRIEAERIIVTKFYPLLPKWSHIFISEDWLISMIDKLYVEMFDAFDDGELNNSIN